MKAQLHDEQNKSTFTLTSPMMTLHLNRYDSSLRRRAYLQHFWGLSLQRKKDVKTKASGMQLDITHTLYMTVSISQLISQHTHNW